MYMNQVDSQEGVWTLKDWILHVSFKSLTEMYFPPAAIWLKSTNTIHEHSISFWLYLGIKGICLCVVTSSSTPFQYLPLARKLGHLKVVDK